MVSIQTALMLNQNAGDATICAALLTYLRREVRGHVVYGHDEIAMLVLQGVDTSARLVDNDPAAS